MFNVLFLCTGNSTRSIVAEAIFNDLSGGRARAYSAGSNPTGRIHPSVLQILARRGISTIGYRSKNWDEYSSKGAPEMHLVLTVCDSVAAEFGPVWPGTPLYAHWGVSDPSAAPREQIDLALQAVFHALRKRITSFLALPFEDLNGVELKAKLDAIGRQ